MMTPACLLGSALLCSLATAVGAAEPERKPQTAAPQGGAILTTNPNVFHTIPSDGGENRLGILTGDAAEQHARRMRERLADPEQRAVMRAEQRASLQQQHSDLARVLGIDQATADRIIELLADQHVARLEHFERSYQPFSRSQPDLTKSTQAYADAETRLAQQLMELLGEQGLWRYREYEASLPARTQVSMFDAQLPAGAKLRDEQKDRLTAILHEQNQRDLQANTRPPLHPLRLGTVLSMEDLRRQSQLHTLRANEESWRRMRESNRAREQRAAQLLTPAQLAVFARMNAQRAQSMQQYIEGERTKAGLNPTIPERDETAEPALTPRTPLAGNVLLKISIVVNSGQPFEVERTVRNGEEITFDAPEGLSLAATPLLYNDQSFEMRVEYYENGPEGKRLLYSQITGGMQSRAADEPAHGLSSTVIAGRRGYSVNLSTSTLAL